MKRIIQLLSIKIYAIAAVPLAMLSYVLFSDELIRLLFYFLAAIFVATLPAWVNFFVRMLSRPRRPPNDFSQVLQDFSEALQGFFYRHGFPPTLPENFPEISSRLKILKADGSLTADDRLLADILSASMAQLAPAAEQQTVSGRLLQQICPN